MILEEGGANNIFSGLTRAQFRDARQTIVKAILCTDMSSHMQHCAEIFQFAQKAKQLRASRVNGAGAATTVATRATRSGALPGKGQERERSKSELAQGRETHGAAGGGRSGVLLKPIPLTLSLSPPLAHIFSVDRAEDRSFLTQTILHWCVCCACV